MEEGIPLGKGLELCVLEDVLHTPDRKKLQSLNLCDVFDFFKGRRRVVELMCPPEEDAGTVEIQHFLVHFCQFKEIVGILL